MFEKQRDTMWITFFLVTLICLSETQTTDNCDDVPFNCKRKNQMNWIKCIEEELTTCEQGKQSRFFPGFLRGVVNSSQQADVNPSLSHRVQIPSSALQRSRSDESKEDVMLVATVINSSLFTVSPPVSRAQGRARMPINPTYKEGTVMGGFVLVVKAGDNPVQNLPHPIKLTFKHNKQEGNGTCVFWHETMNGSGYWSPDGCDTNNTATEFVCSCNHLSFFAVLVNPEVSVDKINAVALSYITYVGSGLCVFFTVITFIVYIRLQRQRPEKAIGVHMHLTGALFCLHLSFLLCCFWVWLKEDEEGLVCQGLGLFLHWSLLATFCWMALEGFHLYLLLVRVFNIYIRRYLLKISLVGWGLPTVTVVICGILGVYGKYSLKLKDDNNHNSTAQICWMSSQFPQTPLVSHITTLAFPSLVILCNSLMLGLVVYKIWKLRSGCGGMNSTGCWKKMNKDKVSRLWKDCTTVLGLSCVLGLTWGLASVTYISIAGIYVFTILNSLQGVFMFLWSLALTCKSRSDNNSSVRDSSSQKMMTTSFNN